MNYQAKSIDPAKLIKDCEYWCNQKDRELYTDKAVLEAKTEGYKAAIRDVLAMMYCSNWEAEQDIETLLKGANIAFYELCKELDVASQDIRDEKISLDEKAAKLADRIQKTFGAANHD